jgi:hypothetical protein
MKKTDKFNVSTIKFTATDFINDKQPNQTLKND